MHDSPPHVSSENTGVIVHVMQSFWAAHVATGPGETGECDVGVVVGDNVGLVVSDVVGLEVGEAVGVCVGDVVGLEVGEAVGDVVGD